MKKIHFAYNPDEGSNVRGELEAGQITLHLPRDAGLEDGAKKGQAPKRYPTRMTQVNGKFTFGPEVIDASFSGLIEGLRYSVRGHADGYDQQHSPFRLSLNTEPFRLTGRPKFYMALPPAAKLFLKEMKPSGRLTIATVVHRDEPGGPVSYDGRVDVLDGSMTYKEFPYTISNIRAEVMFDDRRGARIDLFEGKGSSGSKINITGRFEPDGRVEVDIQALSTPIDDNLRGALNPYSRKSLDEFFDRQAWARLKKEGHFVTHRERVAEVAALKALEDQIAVATARFPERLASLQVRRKVLLKEMSRPVFEMGGVCDIRFSFRMKPGQEKPELTTTVDLLKARGIYEGFVYPIRVHKGRLVLRDDESLFQDIHGVGLNGGKVHMDGRLDLKGRPDGRVASYPDLRLTGSDLPVDGLLFDVLGPDKSHALRQMRLTGRMALDGRIHRKRAEGSRTEVDIGLVLTDGTARPSGGGFLIDQLTGRARMSLDGMRLDAL
ncbi:MAG: hypothetical protein R3236_12090, partial [Phycisphaeraceae bacterium]|nr:hypothetical protein [Phycisphaeraceae bacterium]